MDNLIIAGSNQTPTIRLQRGLIEISGRSIPEDPVAFYKPVMEWLNQYVEDLPEFTQINLQFEYINTSSSKALHNILKTLNDKVDESHRMEINWFYEEGDDDMFELGQFFEPYLRIPIKYIQTEE